MNPHERCVRIAALARDRTVFLHGMCVPSLDSGAERKPRRGRCKRVSDLIWDCSEYLAANRLLRSGSAVSPSETMRWNLFVRETQSEAYFWRNGFARLERKRGPIFQRSVRKICDMYWHVGQLKQQSTYNRGYVIRLKAVWFCIYSFSYLPIGIVMRDAPSKDLIIL